jgi:hypothetical protein
MVNYSQIPSLLANRLDFQGNSMTGVRDQSTGDYVVLSYATEIARVKANGEKIYNHRHYSRTTSRHQNLVLNHL